MLISEYVGSNYHNPDYWFVEECKKVSHQLRVQDILDKKEYLSGLHNIVKRPNEYYNGKVYETRKIVLQYAKTIINFGVNYLLGYPVTLSGDKELVKLLTKVHKQGKYNRVDYDVLNSLVKYGNAYEYLYLDSGAIKSRIIPCEDSYPIYDHENNLISFVEYYCVDQVDYYTVYYTNKVEKYSTQGGEVLLDGVYTNVSGLPVVYVNENELDPCFGRSDLDDYVGIIDNLEDLISKFTDSHHRHHQGIPVIVGQQLKGDGLNPNIVGGGLVLDDGSDFKIVANNLDYHSFKEIYSTLKQALLDVSNTPAVSLNNTDISNLSEVSIKLLFSLADVKASMNEKYLRAGMEQRFDKIRAILARQGVNVADEQWDTLDYVFTYSRPRNEADIIDDLVKLKGIGAISLESVVDHSPYSSDVQQEMKRIAGEGSAPGQDEGNEQGNLN